MAQKPFGKIEILGDGRLRVILPDSPVLSALLPPL
jgi:hypothetical protein